MGASKRPVSDLGPTFSIPVWSILELFDTKLVALQMTRMLLQQRRHYSRAVFPTPQRTRSTTLYPVPEELGAQLELELPRVYDDTVSTARSAGQ